MQLLSQKTWPARLEFLYESMDFVSSCARALGYNAERIGELELVMEEVLVNIIKYAYPDREPEDVMITCSEDGGNLVLDIVDSGVPFDLLAAADPDVTACVDERPVGGLGIYLIKKLADGVKYRREENRNRLTLTVYQNR
jgi:serine/threonine-protein kinase RsbW